MTVLELANALMALPAHFHHSEVVYEEEGAHIPVLNILHARGEQAGGPAYVVRLTGWIDYSDLRYLTNSGIIPLPVPGWPGEELPDVLDPEDLIPPMPTD